MNENNSSASNRKSRRETLGLLLGTALLGSAACSKPKETLPASEPTRPRKKRRVVIIIDEGNQMDQTFNHQNLSQKNDDDNLVVVNLHSKTIIFQVEGNAFEESCVVIKPNNRKILTIKDDGNDYKGTYNFVTTEGTKCPEEFPKETEAAGDIVIDP